MNCERILEFIPKVLDGEALDWEREAVDAHAATCAECGAVRRELVEIGALARAPILAAVSEADFSQLWRGIEAGIGRAERADRARPRVRARGFFGARFGARVASFAAAAAIAAVALLAPAVRSTGVADNHVDVKNVEAGQDQTVTVYTNPDDDVTFIWVEESGVKS